MHIKDPKYTQTLRIGETLNNGDATSLARGQGGPNDPYQIHLQEMITDSCSFYEKMERQKEGAIENMLTGLRSQIDKGKVKIERCY
mmetsp:Transcript_12971/g.17478  ORF Transcript_12971/g.17478 Transcript_12971/m.17478 type:complete len:86 (-) Transcript_12971:93-350(-)|eukprot:CAMPEP_0185621416 /NCGR_PEP_ID=MMETSP0436-20130131/57298_1 /TAXON_ID=626734 ORGANISM="Favella taraikaensis, Strain Fe Narragansett Bay" /NCGR_SAMPLE_ID=MMETSP0436 /ASSEMBLY_ACC=CAM_ASM_000390 /LENGTH=85 /DNA_ID=CAMNT_0028262673 /DNA_START=1169 /DNA_END=1426 /DNA_ORIENTATION=-